MRKRKGKRKGDEEGKEEREERVIFLSHSSLSFSRN
jgi:hypothetical protein